MRHPHLLVCDDVGGLADPLRKLALLRRNRWFFRERRQPESCLPLLRRGSPGVLVLRTGSTLPGRRLERELRLLERAAWMIPATLTVVVCEQENAALLALAWDLGASYVLSPSHPREGLPDLVAGLMKAAIDRAVPEARRPAANA